MFYNRQAEPGSAHLAAPRFIRPVKPLENPGQIIGANSNPLVGNGESHRSLDRLSAEEDGAAGFGIFNGIIEEVVDQLLNPRFVGLERRKIAGKIQMRFNLFLRK